LPIVFDGGTKPTAETPRFSVPDPTVPARFLHSQNPQHRGGIDMLSETKQLCQFSAAEVELLNAKGSRQRVRIPLELDPELIGRPVDELANFATHGIGFLLSLIGSWELLRIAAVWHDRWTFWACVVYSASLVSLYAASTLSHAFFDLRWRRFYQTADQACIFLLIAGSYTPFGAVYLREGWWPILTLMMWGLALCGAVSLISLRRIDRTGQVVYALLGWLPAISLIEIIQAAPVEVFAWIIAGGILYTAGLFFLHLDRRVRYFHATWHAFVIAGSICHYIAIYSMVSGQ
jgi:hemolysin III